MTAKSATAAKKKAAVKSSPPAAAPKPAPKTPSAELAVRIAELERLNHDLQAQVDWCRRNHTYRKS